jgi:fumarate hydratase subunit beta
MSNNITLPLSKEVIKDLHIGDSLSLSGMLYVARDATHKRMVAALEEGKPLPFDIRGQTIYYMGPSPTPPGRVIGAAGPTTSGRMDSYAPRLIAAGLRGMIGKGTRSQTVKDAIKKYSAVYLGVIGGAGALLSRSIIKSETIAYEELGPEAVLKIEVNDFPAIVINDIYGGDLYTEGKKKYQK